MALEKTDPATSEKGKDAAKEDDVPGPPIRIMQLGVYRVVTEILPVSPRAQWKEATRVLPTLLRLVKDVYAELPWSFLPLLLARIWTTCIDPTLSLHLSSQILTSIEAGLKKGSPDATAIFRDVALRMICLASTAAIDWWIERVQPKFRNRIEAKYQNFILSTKLATDLTGVQENRTSGHVSERFAWDAFSHILQTAMCMVSAIGQLTYIFRTVQSTGHGPVFTLLCLIHPILESVFNGSLWSKPHIVEATDPHFLRMKGLRELSEPKYKQDIITGDVVKHVLQEFRKAVKLLGDTDVSEPYLQYHRLNGAASHLAIKLASDLPMLYYAANAVMSPTGFSLATIGTLHQCESMLSWTFVELFRSGRRLTREASSVKAIYDLENIVHSTKGGDLPYPPIGRPHEEGMPFELQNVSFSYPGTDAKALDNITLSIKPGQLIVIVGSNGSGKSTIVKLLTRLYDATAGTITVDGADIREYRIGDMRGATAALTQDHHLYPLSLRENIGLGNPAHVGDMDMIRAAARQGGAEDVIAKQAGGLGTVLVHPRGLKYGIDVAKGDGSLLANELAKMTKEADVSGGERQRLVASRTFMRFTSGAVKLVCVDEPSSNLDPEGEWQLFQNLRNVRAGKTMIFVTHRFAHLTKHADMILCMKNGSIIESGTHDELLQLGGEYCKMFNIQAKAFD